MDLQTATRLLVAEFHMATQEQPTRLVKHSSSSNGPMPPKQPEKKRSWLGLTRRKQQAGMEQDAKAYESNDESSKPSDRGDDDGVRETIRGLRKWLLVLCSQPQLGNNHALNVTTACSNILDAARDQHDLFVEATKPDASEEARQKKSANTPFGLINKLTSKGGVNASSGCEDLFEDDSKDYDDPCLALNTLSEILALPEVASALPMAFSESIISLCFDELNTPYALPERRAAASRCLSVLSCNPVAFAFLCTNVIVKSLQSSKGPSLPKNCHKLRFGFGSPVHLTHTLKIFSLVIASLPKWDGDKLEACLLVSTILESANGFGGNAFAELLDKKQQDQFTSDTRTWCETLLKWSKKRIEPVKQINASLAIGISVWCGLCNDGGREKELSEVLEIRKFFITDRIIPYLKTSEEISTALKLAQKLLEYEAHWELYSNNATWNLQTLGKLMPAVFKYASGNHDVTNLIVLCISVAPDEVLDDWLFAKEQLTLLGGLTVPMRALSQALTKGGFIISSGTKRKLFERHVWPILVATSEVAAQPVTHGVSEEAEESKEEVDEELGISESIVQPWLENERVHSRSSSITSTIAEQQAIYALKAASCLVAPRFTEQHLLHIAQIAVVHPHQVLASKAADLLRELEYRDAVVRCLGEVLSNADRDTPRTREGLALLTDLTDDSRVTESLMTMSLGVVRFHRLASLERVFTEGQVRLSEDIGDEAIRDHIRGIARSRLRPYLRAAQKLKIKKHSGEIAACLAALLFCSGPTEKAEMEAIFSSILIEAVAAPNWVYNRFLWAIRHSLPNSCHNIVCDAIKTRLTMSDADFNPLHPRCVQLLWAVLSGSVAEDVEEHYEDSRWAVLEAVVPKLLAATPSSGPSESQLRAVLVIFGKYFSCSPRPVDSTHTERCVTALTGYGRLSPNLERHKLSVMAGLCKSVDLPDKTRVSFVEYAADWWNQVAVNDNPADFARARSVLLNVLTRNPEVLLPIYADKSLKDVGPKGALYFAAMISWVEDLSSPPPYKSATAVLILAALAQRRSPYDSFARVLEKFASWKKDLSRDKRLLLALLSAEEVRDYGDTGVAYYASKTCAALAEDIFVDPADVIVQAGKICTKLATESAIRVMLIILEPWLVKLSTKSVELLTVLFELSEFALVTGATLRNLVLNIWRACARSCSVHEVLLPFLWSKATPLALQAFRAALEYAEPEPCVRAVLERMKSIPAEQQSSDRVPSVRVEMVLAAVRYGDALRASEMHPDLLSSVLGHLAHIACITENLPAMRVLLRFAKETPSSQDPVAIRKLVLAAVTQDQPVMESACASAVHWISVEGGNTALAVSSAQFIFELHQAQPTGTRRSCIAPGGILQIVRCAVEQLVQSSKGKDAGATELLSSDTLLLRELLRFGSCVDLDADWEGQSVICGIAGACLHQSDLDVQLEASLVLRRLTKEHERVQARAWFVEAVQMSGAEEEDALVQFVGANEKLGLEEVFRVVSGVSPSAYPSTSYRALCIMLNELENTSRVSEGFFDMLSAVLHWENVDVHKRALEIIEQHVDVLKQISPVSARRAIRCAMNDFVHGLNGSEEDKDISKIAQSILLKTVGLDDGISPVPGPLHALFVVSVDTLMSVLQRLVESPVSLPPPLPPSRKDNDIDMATIQPVTGLETVEELEILETIEMERLVSVSNVDTDTPDVLPLAPPHTALEQRRKKGFEAVGASEPVRSEEELDRKRKVSNVPVDKPSSRPNTDNTKPVGLDDIVKSEVRTAAATTSMGPLAKSRPAPLETVAEDLAPSKVSPSYADPGRLISPKSPNTGFFDTGHANSRFETRRSSVLEKRSSSFENLAGITGRDGLDKLRPQSPPAAASKLRPGSPQGFFPDRSSSKSPELQMATNSLDKVPVIGSTPLSPTARTALPAKAETSNVQARRASLEKMSTLINGSEAKPVPPQGGEIKSNRRSSLENILKNGSSTTGRASTTPSPTDQAARKPGATFTAAATVPAAGRAMPGMVELSQLKQAVKSRAVDMDDDHDTGKEVLKKDSGLEHHSMARPLIPAGKRRRPTMSVRLDPDDNIL